MILLGLLVTKTLRLREPARMKSTALLTDLSDPCLASAASLVLNFWSMVDDQSHDHVHDVRQLHEVQSLSRFP